MTIKTAIFDLDHTLYNFMDCHEEADKAVADYVEEHFGIGYDIYRQRLTEAMRMTEDKIGQPNASTHSRTLRYQTLLEDIGAHAIDHAYPMCRAYWDTFYKHMTLEPVVMDILSTLKGMGVTIIVATDMTADVQLEKLRILGINNLVDYLVTSEEAGEEKPGDRILDLCVKKANTEASECVFIGDHPIRDVIGPMHYGMQAVWCRHFDPKRFMEFFNIHIDQAVLEEIDYIIDSYQDCFDDQGRIISLGGLELV